MRTALLLIALVAFASMAGMDLAVGHWRTGVPGLLLVVVNGMLLWRW